MSNKSITKRLLPQIPARLLSVLLLFFVSLLILGFVINEVVIDKEEEIDAYFYTLLPEHASNETVKNMERVSLLGSGIILLPAYILILGYLLYKRKFLLAINIAVIAVSGYALVHGLKAFFERVRPDSQLIETLKNYSFPSGHTVSAFIFSAIVVYLVSRTNLHLVWKLLLALFMICFAISVAISRVILHVHYPTDVIAGATLGVLWVILGFGVLNRIKWKRPKKVNSPPSTPRLN